MLRGQQGEHLAGGPEPDRDSRRVLQVDLEGLQRHVHLGDAADSPARHLDDVAGLECQQVPEPVHLVPELDRLLPSPVQVQFVEQLVQVGLAVLVEFVQGVENGLVNLAAPQIPAAGAADQVQAFRPQTALQQLVVEQFEQCADALPFVESNQPCGDGKEGVDRDLAFDRGQPFCLDCVDISAGEAVLNALRNPHAVAGAPVAVAALAGDACAG